MDYKTIIRNMRTKKQYITWLGYSGFLINEKPVIYIDPFNLAFMDVCDLIIITNKSEHHCSPDDIKWLRQGATIIIAPEDCVELFHGGDIRTARIGENHEIKGARIEILPAYEDADSDQTTPQSNYGCMITFPSGLRVYYSGHTLKIPPLPADEIDVMLFPVTAQAGVDLSRAAELIEAVNPKIAIPMHWEEEFISKDEWAQLNEKCRAQVMLLKPKR